MEQSLKIALVEYDIAWENPKANFNIIDEIIKTISADIFLLPEMFSTGFTMNPQKNAEPFCGDSFQYLQQKSIDKNAVFSASIPTQVDNKYYNRLYWVEPNETFTIYDKRHLFSLVGEQEHYTAGQDRKIIEYKGWKLMPQICYDLRFPVFSRNNLAYDIVFYVANWPEVRNYPWIQLLKARAIENMAFCIGVNRTGKDANNYNHTGDSMIYNPLGIACEFSQINKNVKLFKLHKQELTQTREKFNFLKDKDIFELKVD